MLFNENPEKNYDGLLRFKLESSEEMFANFPFSLFHLYVLNYSD